MKVRKGAAEFEAWQFAPEDQDRPLWVLNLLLRGLIYWSGGDPGYYAVQALGGSIRARPGDWIVQAADGALDVVKQHDFEKLYGEVV